MDFTMTKHRIANRLFGTPIPMAVLNWDNPERTAARNKLVKDIMQSLAIIMVLFVVSAGESLMDLLFNYIGI